MGNRLYTAGIVVFWLAAMSWMVSERILPSFFYGDPPRSGVAFQTEPVAWEVAIDDKPCGVAILQTIRTEAGVREAHSLIRIDRLKRPKSLPDYFMPIASALDTLSPAIRSRMTFDSMGSLLGFKAWIWFGEDKSPMTLTGAVRQDVLKLRVRAGLYRREFEYNWPSGGLMADELAPESRLHLLYVGRKWRREVYSPLSPIKQPVEVLEAEVTQEVLCQFNDAQINAKLVEYRTVNQAGVTEQDRLRGKMWVDGEGRVIKQESMLLGSQLTLNRLSDGESARLAAECLELDKYVATLASNWTGNEGESGSTRAEEP